MADAAAHAQQDQMRPQQRPPRATQSPDILDVKAASGPPETATHDDEHVHYSHRSPWLRAFVLGANDGLVSTASLMLGVGAGADGLKAMQLAGVAGLVAGALSMAAGEYISVSSQKDAEEADIEMERQEQLKGLIAHQKVFEDLVQIYIARGLSEPLARAAACELTDKDVLRAHARDELGIDLDELSNHCRLVGRLLLCSPLVLVCPCWLVHSSQTGAHALLLYVWYQQLHWCCLVPWVLPWVAQKWARVH